MAAEAQADATSAAPIDTPTSPEAGSARAASRGIGGDRGTDGLQATWDRIFGDPVDQAFDRMLGGVQQSWDRAFPPISEPDRPRPETLVRSAQDAGDALAVHLVTAGLDEGTAVSVTVAEDAVAQSGAWPAIVTIGDREVPARLHERDGQVSLHFPDGSHSSADRIVRPSTDAETWVASLVSNADRATTN